MLTKRMLTGHDVARKQNAETALGGHPDILINKVPQMDALGRYMSIMLECGRARLAALGV